MFVKIYQYRIQPNKEEEYLEIQEKAAAIYAKHIDLKSVHIIYNANHSKWIQITWFKDEESYNRGIKLVNKEIERKKDLWQAFQSVLESRN
ncbi:hypothetical protein [Chengkuizengella marina]|uniref:Antibiotic biosynthesis monooxygenase n=1 Tax=Chengkuizengella marina TaxID=2507566 RepID=A0A6N9PZU1_9BACL|nr:hypothetical protein [Chengkuizengella marina]NBI27943.1 hypothetical protein [Chengkuizengella marina]